VALSKHDIDAVVALLVADLRGTLSWTEDQARTFVQREADMQATYVDDAGRLAWHLTESIQQRLHDEFVDTTWPACPIHHRHPLWLNEDDEGPWFWRCRETGQAIAPLGHLRTEAYR